MGKRSKRYMKMAEGLKEEAMPLSEAVKKLKTFTAKFDQTIDCVMHLGIDTKMADQLVRGSISLPHGIGKSKRVIAFCDESDAAAAKEAGAMEAGADELVKKVEGGWMDFDVAIAHPKVMGKVGKLGRVLGPQGKMPSPKNGTVTADIKTAIREFAAGKVEFRNDTGGNVHVLVGKQSFDEQKLTENIEALLSHIKKIKPASTKGTYIKKMVLSATMSPGLEVIVS
jgi:large subunit ribosomal protein L1